MTPADTRGAQEDRHAPRDEPATTVAEVARLRAELASTRAERDELAQRLAAQSTSRPVPGRGQLPLPGLVTMPQRVLVDLPLDVQSTSERGLPWAFLDEARNPRSVVPGAYLVAGDGSEPVLVQVVELSDDGRVHVRLVGPGPFIPADLKLEAVEPGAVWAPVPSTGEPPVGAVVLAGTATAWSWAQVEAVEDGWLLLRPAWDPRASHLASSPAIDPNRPQVQARDGFVDVTGVELAGEYHLRLTWADGAITVVDAEPYLWGDVGAPVRDPAVFATVVVDPNAGTIVWPATGLDISPAELRRAGRPHSVAAPTPLISAAALRTTFADDAVLRALTEYAAVGAAAIAGIRPDSTWGTHTEPTARCRTCTAWRWFDQLQALLEASGPSLAAGTPSWAYPAGMKPPGVHGHLTDTRDPGTLTESGAEAPDARDEHNG